MALYEYVCLACERPFEDRRPMSAPLDTALACPSCGSDRVRRRFTFVAARPGEGPRAARPGEGPRAAGAGCGCGGACGCGR